MRIDVIGLFPDVVRAFCEIGMVGRAAAAGLVDLHFWDVRDYAQDARRTVDDRPYGGGPGMVLMPGPLVGAIRSARAQQPAARVAYLSPQGARLDHAAVMGLAQRPGMILVAGRYEGIDERVVVSEIDEEWSIGDYVLSGGEAAAAVIIDAVVRQLPGVLGHAGSAREDSFAEGLLDCGHYTRPPVFEGQEVPEVLLSGDHARIRQWRLKQSLGRTWLRRPDLLADRALTAEEKSLLEEFKREYRGLSS
ncbi:MAG: tRNA (guanosine(37)-N1)-methyltransferase TrmD [Gammaproteobacteria bacterium]|nr:tRNA (guanosine(37)-N1)-methyltransferase TrmD [Gammaproteobacteria bacterium]